MIPGSRCFLMFKNEYSDTEIISHVALFNPLLSLSGQVTLAGLGLQEMSSKIIINMYINNKKNEHEENSFCATQRAEFRVR